MSDENVPSDTRLAPLDKLDRLLALGLGVVFVVSLLMTAKNLGYARDEGFYFQAAQSYGAWFQLLAQDPRAAFEQGNVDRFFAANHEHPALMKSLFALSHQWFFERLHWFGEQGTAYRFPGMAMASLAVATLYIWGRQVFGRWAGFVAATAFALMPRVFYHSHLACFDIPVAAMWLATAYVYFRSLHSKHWGWVLGSGVLFGLLLDTKHNAWFLPPALVSHLLLTRGRVLWNGFKNRRFPIPLGLVSMAILGPLVFYALWPWIWHSTVDRLREYARFHLEHEYYNMEFLGHTYWKPPMPRLYAWLMTIATVPGITLVLFLLGWMSGAVRHLWPGIRRSITLKGSDGPEAARVDVKFDAVALWSIALVVSYAPWFSSDTPIFGGTKHWMTAYPFLCLLAGLGFATVRERLRAFLGRKPFDRVATPALAAACLVGPLAMTVQSHPWGLSFYTPLVGGASGAASLGLNRTFWGYTTDSVLGVINQRAPRNAGVYLHDTAYQSWEMLRVDGRARRDLRPTLAIHQSQFALYHHEAHMRRVEYQIWMDYGTAQPAALGVYDGVPIVWAYQRPPPRLH